MKQLLIFIFLILSGFGSFGQNFQWARVDSGYDCNSSFAPNLIIDGKGLIYQFSQLGQVQYYDSTTSTTSNINSGSLITVRNSSGKLIKSNKLPGRVQSAAMDKKGNLYLTGFFTGKFDFDPGKASFILNSDGSDDVFILKYDASGKLIMALRIGGTSSDYSTLLEIDTDFNLNIFGRSYSSIVDFDPGASTYKINGAYFILKLDTLGKFISVKTNQNIPSYRIRDNKGNIYNIGTYRYGIDLDPDSVKTYYLNSIGSSYDVYIQKLDSKGKLIWAKSIGGKYADNISSIALDKWQNVYTTGSFEDSVDLDPSSKNYYIESNGKTDVFMSKLDSMGNFVWGLRVGGTDNDAGSLVTVDDSSNVYFCGTFQDSVDFDPGSNQFKLFGNAFTNYYKDLYILKLNSNGKFLSAKTLVNTSYKSFTSITIDNLCNLYLAGFFVGTLDFNPDASKYEKTSTYTYAPFLLKLGPCPSPTESTISGPAVLCGKEKKGTYSVTQSSGAKGYIWRVPKGVKIDSGQGTNKIYVSFDSIFGEISVRPTNICDTSIYSYLNVKYQPTLPNVLAYSSLTKVCKGDYVQLYGGGNATSYVWDKGVKNYSYFYPDSTDSYIVTGTDKNGCNAKDTITVIVGAKSPASIKGLTAICKNGKAFYSVNPTKEARGYFWTVPSDAKIDSGQNTSAIYVTFGSASGNISVIPNNACTTNPTLIYISVENLSIGKNVSPSTSICKGVSVTLSGTGGSNYKWSGGITNGISFKPDSTTKYILTVTGNNGCIVKDSVTINVGVNSPPAINGPSNACNGGKATFSVATIAGAKGYLWSVPMNATIDSGQNTNTLYVRFGAYSGNVSVIPANACTTIKTDKYVTVTSLSIGINVSPISATVCKGSSVILSGTGGTNYTWTRGVKDGVSFIPDTTASYTVNEINALGCIGTNSILIKVNPLPIVGAYSTNSSVCLGSGTTLYGTGASSYLWSDGILNGVFFKPSVTKTYSVTGTDANGCKGTSSFTINVSKKPSLILQPINQTEAMGNSVKFITSSSSTKATFQWQQNAGIGFTDLFDAGPYSGTNNDTLIIYPVALNQNNFKYRCIAMDDGCIDTSKTATLFVKTGKVLNLYDHQNIKVYPNPSTHYIIIESEELLNKEPYLISDQIGRVILKGELNHKTNRVDITPLASGFYFIQIGEATKQTYKIFKQ
jgi:hypothetical protein